MALLFYLSLYIFAGLVVATFLRCIGMPDVFEKCYQHGLVGPRGCRNCWVGGRPWNLLELALSVLSWPFMGVYMIVTAIVWLALNCTKIYI